MANANISKIGLNSAVAAEEAAKAEAPAVAPNGDTVAPNVAERRIVGTVEYPAPNGSKIVVTHL